MGQFNSYNLSNCENTFRIKKTYVSAESFITIVIKSINVENYDVWVYTHFIFTINNIASLTIPPSFFVSMNN